MPEITEVMFLVNIKRFIKYFGEGKKLQLCGFAGLSLAAGFLEFIGIALIYPFIMMIISPEIMLGPLSKLTAFTHTQNSSINALLIGFAVLLIFIAKNIFMIFTTFLQNKFVANWKRDINKKLMQYYLWAPYDKIIKTAPSDMIYTVNILSNHSIDGYMVRALNFLTNTIIVTLIVSLLMIKFPIAAVITMAFIICSMIFQNKYFKKRTAEIAETMQKYSQKSSNNTLENLNNLKEIKILSGENYFFDKYYADEKQLRKIQAQYNYYSGIPPYIVEILIVMALLILTGIISVQNIDNNSSMIASFAIITASIFRIAPALNRIQTSIINMNSHRNFVQQINSLYEEYELNKLNIYPENKGKKLDFRNAIELKNIEFSYNPEKPVIKNLSLSINKGDFIGIIGLSGAGKSTLADIILGLLPPQNGEIFVDGNRLTAKNYPMFRHIVGYVPQQINILDKSFRENVAWGVPVEDIDDEKVVFALKSAQIYDFVQSFENGIYSNTIVGSNGISQGQKQRIAIARALYRNPDILIFDEATSSLDVKVENEITEMLEFLRQSKTIIAIAHRLSTLKACNKIVYMKDGIIADVGTFEELSLRHEDFANLVKLSSLSK